MKCEICDKESGENVYCESHARAYENIIKKHDLWAKALEISWKEYLSEIAENSLAGAWVKEVAEHLARKGEE